MKYVLEEGKFKNKVPALEVHWDTILMCQYTCSYCYSRDRKDWLKFPESNNYKTIINAMSKSYLPINLGLLGGEPTIHPNYKDILHLWNEKCGFNENFNVPNTLYTSTNGVRDLKWFKGMPSYPNMSFVWSFHPEHTDNDVLGDKIKVMLDKGYECGVNIMMLPAKKYRDKAVAMHKMCKELGIESAPTYLHTRKNGTDDRVMLNYTEDFWSWVNDNFELVKKEKYLVKLQDEEKVTTLYLTEDEIFENRYNLFQGYSCMLNHYKINVDGTVGALRIEDNRTSLTQDNDYFKSIRKIQKLKCPLPACTCAELLEIPKSK